MPVPVTPTKVPSNGVAGEEDRAVVESYISSGCVPDPCVVAGYQDCLRETIRFLVHEENLPVEHPVVTGLTLHLTSDTAHRELEKLSTELAQTLNQEVKCKKRQRPLEGIVKTDGYSSEDSGFGNALSEDEEDVKGTLETVKAYEITLEEDTSDDDCEMEEEEEEEMDMEEILVTAQDILANATLRRELLKLVFQGCDLVASPNSEITLSSQNSS